MWIHSFVIFSERERERILGDGQSFQCTSEVVRLGQVVEDRKREESQETTRNETSLRMCDLEHQDACERIDNVFIT